MPVPLAFGTVPPLITVDAFPNNPKYSADPSVCNEENNTVFRNVLKKIQFLKLKKKSTAEMDGTVLNYCLKIKSND